MFSPEIGMVHPMLNILFLSGKEIIKDNHFMTFLHELIHQMTSNKSSSAGNKNFLPLGIGNLGSIHNVRGCGGGKRLGGKQMVLFQNALLCIVFFISFLKRAADPATRYNDVVSSDVRDGILTLLLLNPFVGTTGTGVQIHGMLGQHDPNHYPNEKHCQ